MSHEEDISRVTQLSRRLDALENNKIIFRIVESSVVPVRWVGYGLVLAAIIDFIFLLIPFKFYNPEWQIEVIYIFVNQIPLLLIGFIGIFWGLQLHRKKIEKILLPFFSWIALLIAILLIISFPLIVSDVLRINKVYSKELGKYRDAIIKLDNNKEAIAKINTINEMKDFLATITTQDLKVDASVNIEQVKQSVISIIEQQRAQIQKQFNTIREQKITQFKHAAIIFIEGLIGIILLVIVWRKSKWSWSS